MKGTPAGRMKNRIGLIGSELKGWYEKGKTRLGPYRPRFGERQFWVIQAIVIGIAGIHDFIEVNGYLPHLGALYFLPISLFFLPVVYAALNFGLAGSIATVLWIVIITIPNWVFWHQGLERIGVIFQMLIFVAVAVFVGQRVDREASERRKAETAGAALRTYAAHVVNIQEDERKNLARELHDQTIQTLALLCRQLDSISARESLSSAVIQELSSAREISEGVVKSLRDFARNLRPPHLDDLGILDSLSKLLLDFSDRTGIKGQLSLIWKERRLPPDTEVGLFRIAQEALWNVERHSKATDVAVIITFGISEVKMTISDNGVGFKVPTALSDLSGSNHFGIVGMHERAELFGGKLEIQSDPGKGTTVSVSFPTTTSVSGD